MRRLRKSATCVLVLALAAVMAYGQADQGRISGAVKDVSGALVPGVTVTVKNERTGEERVVLSGDSGAYLVPALRPSE